MRVVMEIFKLEKAPLVKNLDRVLSISHKIDLKPYITAINKPEYLYWDKAKYKPCPSGISPEDLWALVKFFRQNLPERELTPICTESGQCFSWQLLSGLDFTLRNIDMKLGPYSQSIKWNSQLPSERFITRGVMEEAIASSQLEGANTTRKAAKKMLLEKRKPSSRSEQMILNNYQAMIEIEEKFSEKHLSKNDLLELHVTLTHDTIPDKDVGRFRIDNDKIIVGDSRDDLIYHIPPAETFFNKELDNFLHYANDVSLKNGFIHPVIKAIILHFWLAYLHPFTDGNGRLARALFYWYLLKNNYRGFAFLPVSRVIRNSPAQYRNAFLYSEQDDNDLTYFIDYYIRKIEQAQRDFENYLDRKASENKKMVSLAQSKYSLNERQIQLLRYFNKNTGATTTIMLYAGIYNVTRLTAGKDLKELEKLGFIISSKKGREKPFRGTDKIVSLFE